MIEMCKSVKGKKGNKSLVWLKLGKSSKIEITKKNAPKSIKFIFFAEINIIKYAKWKA